MVTPPSPAMRAVFDVSVHLLEVMAAWLGTTYVALNVWLFVVIMPAVIALQALAIGVLAMLLRRRRA